MTQRKDTLVFYCTIAWLPILSPYLKKFINVFVDFKSTDQTYCVWIKVMYNKVAINVVSMDLLLRYNTFYINYLLVDNVILILFVHTNSNFQQKIKVFDVKS